MYNVATCCVESPVEVFHSGGITTVAKKKSEKSIQEEETLKPVRLALDPATHQMLRELAAKAGLSMTVYVKQEVTALVNEEYKRLVK